MKKHFLSMLLLWVCLIGGAIPASAWKDIKIDLTNGNLLTDEEKQPDDDFSKRPTVKFGVAIADDGTATRVEADDASAAIVISGKYHSKEHGWNNFRATVAVDGPVKISAGTCAWGSNVTATNTAGQEVVKFSNNDGTCYHQNTATNIAYAYYKGTDATTLSINGGNYMPYIAIEKVSASDIEDRLTFSLGSTTAEGTLPSSLWVKNGGTYTIPVNHTLYAEGKTLTGWSDGKNTYKAGDVVTLNDDMTLTAVFTDNTKTLADRTKDVTLLWDFQRQNGAPTFNFQNKTGIYVIQTTIGGETIDVKLDMDATKGKVNNSGWVDWCQWNPNTKFTIPSCKGAVVTLTAMNQFGRDGQTATTIDGSSDYTASNPLDYTVTSESETIDIVIGTDGSWYKSVQVVLPYVKPEGTEDVTLFTLKVGSESFTMNKNEEVDLSSYATVSGGTAKYHSGLADGSTFNKDGEGITTHGSSGNYFTITLTEDNTFKEGDVITLTASNNQYACEVSFSNKRTGNLTLDTDCHYTVTAADAGKTTFYIYNGNRDSSNKFYGWAPSITDITVVRPASQPILQTLTIDGTDILPTLESKEYTYNVSSYDNLPVVGATANDKGEVEITQASADNGYKATVVLKNKATQETVATYTITFNKINVIGGKSFQWTTGDGTTTSLSDGTDYKYIRTSTVNPSFAIKGKSNVYSDNRFKTDMGTGNTWALVVPSNAIVEKVEFLGCQDAYYKYGGDETKAITTKLNVASEGATVTTTDKDGNVLEYLSDAQTVTSTLVNHQAGEPITFYAEGGSQLAFSGVKIYYSLVDNGTLNLVKQSVSDGADVDINGSIAFIFDNDITLADGASVTVNGNKVRTTVSGPQLTAYYWGLSYNSRNTVTLAANSVKDAFGNAYDKEISLTVNTGSKKTVDMKEYDYVVSNTSELDAAIEALKTSNKTVSAERKTVFLKNGDYKYGTLEGNYQANVSLKIDNWNNIYNVSFIGESKDGVVISGTTKGITSATMNLGNGTGVYLQDLTIRNNYEFRTGTFTSVNVALLGGNKAILKNVALQATQDTYVTGDRTYLENCDIYGTIDFICGGGDNFFESCNLVLCDRGDDVIVAPNTDATKQWGYVFQNCTVKADEGATAVVDKGWYLGRPWQNEPRAYYLNTKMEVLAADAGWTKMSDLPTHFYEYNSVDKNGEKIDLSVRKNSPSSTNQYTPVLTDTEAAEFTTHNVIGGTDAWDAAAYTVQTAAPQSVKADGAKLTWQKVDDALLYAIFKDGQYIANTTATEYTATESGTYTVRAANEMGGLGEASAAAEVTLKITAKLSAGGTGTFCAAQTVKTPEGLTAYTATVSDNTVTLTKVADGIIPAGNGVVLSGEANATYDMQAATSDKTTLDANSLVGTTERTLIENDNTYVLVYDATAEQSYFKNFQNGAYIPAGKAYLPIEGTTQSSKLMVVFGDTDGINSVSADRSERDTYYTLGGQRTLQPVKGIYIHNGKKVVFK